MNIFILDYDLEQNAKYHVDKHVSKMILESVQVLCTAYYATGKDELAPYKKTHYNHPVSVWSRQSLNNWLWLRDYALALYDEFDYRYNNKHKSGELLFDLPLPDLPVNGLTKFPQCMPNHMKSECAVESYRRYYKECKSHLFKWTGREIPSWIECRKEILK